MELVIFGLETKAEMGSGPHQSSGVLLALRVSFRGSCYAHFGCSHLSDC